MNIEIEKEKERCISIICIISRLGIPYLSINLTPLTNMLLWHGSYLARSRATCPGEEYWADAPCSPGGCEWRGY